MISYSRVEWAVVGVCWARRPWPRPGSWGGHGSLALGTLAPGPELPATGFLAPRPLGPHGARPVLPAALLALGAALLALGAALLARARTAAPPQLRQLSAAVASHPEG